MLGTVVYDASQGYDEDAWDDSALIKAYDKAKESSRELQRVRKEGKKRKREWALGEACRAAYSEDGEEYEGTVVNKNVGNRSVTVRFHGYNNEEEVRISDLMESFGPEAVEEQVEQARLDEDYEEDEEEEEGAGDDFRVGDWCRAEWSEDAVVYEAVIESINRKKGTAKVRFLGFNNMEEKELDDLFLSKGEERRKEQEERSEGGIREDEIHDLIAKNCPDLLSNFGEPGDGVEDLDLGKLSMSTKSKKSKSKSSSKNESSKDRSLHEALTSEFSEEQVKTEMIGEGGSISSKENRKREKKQKKEKKTKKEKTPKPDPPLPPFPNHNSILQNGPMTMPSPWGVPQGMSFGVPQSPMAPMFPPTMPSMPMSFQPPSMPNMPPPPPMLDSMDPSLHSLLLSWYMAGFEAGRYQTKSHAKAPKSKSPVKS